MRIRPVVRSLSILAMGMLIFTGAQATAADSVAQNQGPTTGAQEAQAPAPSTPVDQNQGPTAPGQGAQVPVPSAPPSDPSANLDQRLSAIEEWKAKIERLPSLSDKFNVGMNALQFLYTHQDAHVAEGKSQDNLSIRRSELLFYGKINEYVPKWHALAEFQSINLTNTTPGCAAGSPCNTQPVGTAGSATYFRESYIDFRPIPSIAPNLNMIRMGIFRMPFGIFTETSRWSP